MKIKIKNEKNKKNHVREEDHCRRKREAAGRNL